MINKKNKFGSNNYMNVLLYCCRISPNSATYSLIALSVLIFASCSNPNPKSNVNDSDKDSVRVEVPKILSAEDIYNQSINKVAMIISYQGGIPLSQGSGFFIEKNTLITNYHCIEGSDAIELKIAGNNTIFKGAKVVKAAKDYDIAIIQTKQDFPFLELDSLENENVGSKVYTIGNPRGLEGTISDGILSGRRHNENTDYLQITAPINPGNSGGPLLNEKGIAIGISTFTFRNSQNINFAMPIKYISKCTSYNPSSHSTSQKTKKNSSCAISLTVFEKNGSEFYEFLTLKNNSNDVITAVTGVIIYKTMSGEILDYRIIDEDVIIPIGLAKRIKRRSFDQDQNWKYHESDGYSYKKFKIEFRLLSYETEE